MAYGGVIKISKNNLIKLNEKLKEWKSPLFSINDMILILLYANDKPIIRRTVLFKELFLMYKEVIPKYFNSEEIPDFEFVPYKYGPYSFKISEILLSLNYNGLIIIKGRAKGKNEAFILSEKGKNIINSKLSDRDIINNTNDFILELREKRTGWDQLGRSGILNYVYTYYPKYKTNSLIKNKYGAVKWGTLFEE
jgi:uncharacterized protein YwgA